MTLVVVPAATCPPVTEIKPATVGTGNVGMGQGVMGALTNGSGNVIIGHNAAQLLNTGSNNVAIGKNSLIAMTVSVQNVAIGHSALALMTTSTGSNTAVGYSALASINTGTANIGLGSACGSSFTGTESSNILIGSSGVLADNNTIRIGTNGSGTGQQNKAYIAGITAVTVSSSEPVGVDTNGQLSSLGFGTSGQIFRSNGAGSSPTWSTATYPATAGTTGNVLTSDGTNWVASAAAGGSV